MKDNRRQFLKKGGVLAAASIAGLSSCSTNKPEVQKVSYIKDTSFNPKQEPYMKIAYQASPEPTPEQLAFYQQMGIEHVVLWTGADKASYEYYNSR
ncbi:MAG: twin-arginine translocation signal domain-containing protein, partial [Bacteroidales bacterium]|nr:twin-arginine translocation signal domain-containing protein [Bacteroidales bacterium]